MSVRPLVVPVLLLAAPATAQGLTAGRLWSLVAAVLAVSGVAAGAPALARSRRGWGRAAVAAGSAAVLVGALVVVTADGGPGSGSGIVGGALAAAVGAVAVVLGGLALARTRRGGRVPARP